MDTIFNTNAETFQTQVVDRSADVPVLLLFWAAQAPEAAAAKTQLEALVGQYGGKVALALVDVSQDRALAQHLRVQALPSLRVISKGQIAHQAEGPQSESALRALLDQLTLSASERIAEQLDDLLERRDFQAAKAFLSEAIREEPANARLRVELADLLVRQGDLAGARKALDSAPADAPERDRPETRLGLVEEAANLPSRAKLAAALEAAPDDLELCYQLAVAEAASERFEAALEHAWSLLARDRNFRDDLGRRTLLRLFAVLGRGSDLAARYRRRLFALLH